MYTRFLQSNNIFRMKKKRHSISIIVVFLLCCFSLNLKAQQVSPYQTGAYSTAFMGVRDMAKGSPGLLLFGTTNMLTPISMPTEMETFKAVLPSIILISILM